MGVAAQSAKLMVQGWCPANDFQAAQVGEGAGWLIQAAHYEGTTVAHDMNGVQIDSDAHLYDTSRARIRLGMELNDRHHIDMDVAELLVYDRALSASDSSFALFGQPSLVPRFSGLFALL